MGKIDWDDMLGGNFIRLDEGKQKVMVVSNWKPQTKFKDDKTGETRPGLSFDVHEEDGRTLEETKEWTVTSVRALAKLRPIIEKAEAAGTEKVKIQVLRVGDKKDTQYSINEV